MNAFLMLVAVWLLYPPLILGGWCLAAIATSVARDLIRLFKGLSILEPASEMTSIDLAQVSAGPG